MAKKKDESAEEAETNRSIGSKMETRLSTHARNLAVKQELIDKGERDEPKQPPARTQRERNLAIKEQLKKEKKDESDDEPKPKTGKGKG